MDCSHKKGQERERENEEQQQIFGEKSVSCKINPEGTRGPIWLGVVPFCFSYPWLYYCVKKTVNMLS